MMALRFCFRNAIHSDDDALPRSSKNCSRILCPFAGEILSSDPAPIATGACPAEATSAAAFAFTCSATDADLARSASSSDRRLSHSALDALRLACAAFNSSERLEMRACAFTRSSAAFASMPWKSGSTGTSSMLFCVSIASIVSSSSVSISCSAYLAAAHSIARSESAFGHPPQSACATMPGVGGS